MRDMPPIDMEADSPRASGGPGSLVPACVALREDGTLTLQPMEGASIEERELIGRICLCRWMYVEPRAMEPMFERRPVEPETAN
jgi:hypothetical protein